METHEMVLKISHGMIKNWWDWCIERNEAEGRQGHARKDYIAMHLSGRSASFIRGWRLLCGPGLRGTAGYRSRICRMRSSNTSLTCQSLFALVSYIGDSVKKIRAGSVKV